VGFAFRFAFERFSPRFSVSVVEVAFAFLEISAISVDQR
jgi:hypothetical protein